MARLDVAMFNAILRESANEIPTDPVSDPISDPKVLPIPAGKSSFQAGAQLKNAVSDIRFLVIPRFSQYLCHFFMALHKESCCKSDRIQEIHFVALKELKLL